MATLETQYRNFMELNPECEFTFEEWKIWFGNKLSESVKDLKEFVENDLED
jgi:hypothetical protein